VSYRIRVVPDEAEKDEDDSDHAADRLDVGRVLAPTSSDEVVYRRDGDVFQQQRHRQLVV